MQTTNVTPVRRLSGKRILAWWVLAITAASGGELILRPGLAEMIGYQLLCLALGLLVILWVTGGPPHRLAEKRVSIYRRVHEGVRQILLPLLAILFIAFAVLIVTGLVLDSSSASGVEVIFIKRSVTITLLGLAVIFFLAGVGLCWIWARRLLRRPLLLAQDGQNLIVYSLLGRRVLPGAGLLARRLLPVEGDGPVQGFIFETDPLYSRPVTVAFGAGHWRRRAVFEPLYAWLGEHGIPVIDMRAVIAPSRLRQLGAALGEGVVDLTGFLATFAISLITIHWLIWLRYGVMVFHARFPHNGFSHHWFAAFSFSLMMGFIYLVSPVRGWVWKLFAGLRTLIGRRDRMPGAVPVYIAEAWPPPNRWASTTRRGWLRIEDDALTLGWGRQALTIRRGQIQDLRPHGWRHRWLSLTVPRQISRPVELAWLDEQYEEHTLLLFARGGCSFGQDRRLDRRLYADLQDWLCNVDSAGEAVAPAEEPDRQRLAWSWPAARRPRLAPLLGALFLLLGLGSPFLHNHLVMTRIRTGQWFPPTKIHPAHLIKPAIYGVAALEPGPIFYQLTQDWDQSTQPNLWIGEPFQGPWRPLGFGSDSPMPSSVPGDRSHYLSEGEHGLATVLFPSVYLQFLLHLRSYYDESYFEQFPAQVVSADSGKIIELPKHYLVFQTALYRDQRLFVSDEHNLSWVFNGNTYEDPGYYDISCLDLITMKSHPLGRIMAQSLAEDRKQNLPVFYTPQFFPDGLHVLYNGHVIDLETGKKERIDWSHNPSELNKRNVDFKFNTFTMGNRLRMRIEEEIHGGEWANHTLTEVWEIDPETARVELVDRLPLDARLISADGDRWLLKTPIPENDRNCVLSLYDHAKFQSRELRREPTYFNPDPITVLLAGQPRYARWSEQEGWKVFETGEPPLGTAR